MNGTQINKNTKEIKEIWKFLEHKISNSDAFVLSQVDELKKEFYHFVKVLTYGIPGLVIFGYEVNVLLSSYYQSKEISEEKCEDEKKLTDSQDEVPPEEDTRNSPYNPELDKGEEEKLYPVVPKNEVIPHDVQDFSKSDVLSDCEIIGIIVKKNTTKMAGIFKPLKHFKLTICYGIFVSHQFGLFN